MLATAKNKDGPTREKICRKGGANEGAPHIKFGDVRILTNALVLVTLERFASATSPGT